MDNKLKQRVTGAIVLTALAIIILPMLLDGSEEERARVIANIPEPPTVDLTRVSAADIADSMKAMEAASEAALPKIAPPADLSPADPSPAETEPPSTAFRLDENDLPVSWSLQLASFQSEENARRLRASLREAEYQSYILQAKTGQGEMYRVFVGPVLQRSQLTAMGQEIEDRFELKGQIVRYEATSDDRQLGG